MSMNNRPIAIIGAMAVEVKGLIDQLENRNTQRTAGLLFHEGTLNGTPCVVAQCGPGKVNSAVCAQIMILRYEPRLIINVGVAGGVGVGIGDLVVASACVQHDFDTTAMGDPLGTLFICHGEDVDQEELIELRADEAAAKVLLSVAKNVYGGAHEGVIATGDVFVADKEKNLWLSEKFGAKAVEMEGGSIAQTCYMNGVPFAVLRAISDNANDQSPEDFPAFAKECAKKTLELLFEALPKL